MIAYPGKFWIQRRVLKNVLATAGFYKLHNPKTNWTYNLLPEIYVKGAMDKYESIYTFGIELFHYVFEFDIEIFR